MHTNAHIFKKLGFATTKEIPWAAMQAARALVDLAETKMQMRDEHSWI